MNGPDDLTLRIPETEFGLSKRRVLEHVQYGQILPFPRAIDHQHPEDVVDIVRFSQDQEVLAGVTLGDLTRPGTCDEIGIQLVGRVNAPQVVRWLQELREELRQHKWRRAVRNRAESFLPIDPETPFGLRGLRSALRDWIEARANERMPLVQWSGRVRNLPGLRRDEESSLGLKEQFDSAEPTPRFGHELLRGERFEQFRLSVIPATTGNATQLELRPLDQIYWRSLPRARFRRLGTVIEILRDRFLGYSLERRAFDDLFGRMEIWMIYDHRGQLIRTRAAPKGHFLIGKDAIEAAQRHAALVYPKLSTIGHWSEYRLTGGSRYREWLVTLPMMHAGFFSGHFPHRNLLLHVRADSREGLDGERILFLQEVQSDWAQHARKQKRDAQTNVPTPPWLSEWPALALKLMILHAIHHGYNAIAWTTGEQQVERWHGEGTDGLRELYDRTLPREANRLLSPFGGNVSEIAFFQPANFGIEPTEDGGYAVFGSEDELITQCRNWGEVVAAIPCGSREDAVSAHGIRLSEELTADISARGLCAWGNALR